jgi:hypothetical protein
VSESTDLSDAIANAANGPKRVQGDEGEVEQHDLADLIEADRYLQQKAAASNGAKAMRLTKIVPPGAT